jgi:A/G-specific adenine glycosylase
MKNLNTKVKKFQELIWAHYKQRQRGSLLWRTNTSDYYVCISEIMLQQTQVDRVIPFFNNWIQHFPNWQALSAASQVSVLKHWKGLGYNSRALRLHALSKQVVSQYGSILPVDYETLTGLPGIGPYTAGAIMAFVYNKPVIMIETNIRRVFLYHFFQGLHNIHDRDILPIIEQSLPNKKTREWYWALMDYGSYLGKELKIDGKKFNPNTASRHYIRQSKFTGSDRQIRGKILEVLLQPPDSAVSLENIAQKLSGITTDTERIFGIVQVLIQEGFVIEKRGKIILKK